MTNSTKRKIISIVSFFLTMGSFYYLFKSIVPGIVFLGYIFFHESGHYIVARHFGIRSYGIYFIPFFGGITLLDDDFVVERKKTVLIAVAGPFFGAIYNLILLFIGGVFKLHILGLFMLFTIEINLLNLLPIYPLDGGRIFLSIVMSISKKINIVLRVLTSILLIWFLWFNHPLYPFTIFVFLMLLFIIFFGFSDEEVNAKKMSVKWIIFSIFLYLFTIFLTYLPAFLFDALYKIEESSSCC